MRTVAEGTIIDSSCRGKITVGCTVSTSIKYNYDSVSASGIYTLTVREYFHPIRAVFHD